MGVGWGVTQSVGDWDEKQRVLGLSPGFRQNLEGVQCADSRSTFRALPRYISVILGTDRMCHSLSHGYCD